jgi:hypothetical protein
VERGHLAVIVVRLRGAAGFEHEHGVTGCGQVGGNGAAAGSGADDHVLVFAIRFAVHARQPLHSARR